MPSNSHLSVSSLRLMTQFSKVHMSLLKEQTNSENVVINLWPSNSKGEIMHLRLSFFYSYCDELTCYDGAFNDSAWVAIKMPFPQLE